jgi:hypothetical protein
MLVIVLIALALLLGLLFGGSAIWYLKPSTSAGGGVNTVVNTVNKYVCSDGTVKDAQNQCPTVKTDASGNTQVTCPVCPPRQTCTAAECGSLTPKTYTTYEQCQQCASQCGGIMILPTTTTMTPPPVCRTCTTDSDCGVSSYSDMRCKNDEAYKMLLNPSCHSDKTTTEKCCQTIETYTKIET